MSTFSISFEKNRFVGEGARLIRILCFGLALIGITYYLSVPKVISVKGDGSEVHLAISRAEAANMAMVSFIQSRGREVAIRQWSEAMSPQDQYGLLVPYLAYDPESLDSYMPSDYEISFPLSLENLEKVNLTDPEGNPLDY